MTGCHERFCLPVSSSARRGRRLLPGILLQAGLLSLAGCSSRLPALDDVDLPSCAGDGGTAFVETESVIATAWHREGSIEYDAHPPAGGDHSSCWGRWGVHDQPLPAERFVHNMEHGGVVLMYHCPAGCESEREWLTEFVRRHPLTVLTEYSKMDTPFAVTAWGARATSSCLDPNFVRDFYERRVNRGPERFALPPPEPPDSCQ